MFKSNTKEKPYIIVIPKLLIVRSEADTEFDVIRCRRQCEFKRKSVIQHIRTTASANLKVKRKKKTTIRNHCETCLLSFRWEITSFTGVYTQNVSC